MAPPISTRSGTRGLEGAVTGGMPREDRVRSARGENWTVWGPVEGEAGTEPWNSVTQLVPALGWPVAGRAMPRVKTTLGARPNRSKSTWSSLSVLSVTWAVAETPGFTALVAVTVSVAPEAGAV